MTTVIASDRKTSQKTAIIMAKENELDKLPQFNTYEEVVDNKPYQPDGSSQLKREKPKQD